MKCHQCKDILKNPIRYEGKMFCDSLCIFQYKRLKKFSGSKQRPRRTIKIKEIDLGDVIIVFKLKINSNAEYMNKYHWLNREKIIDKYKEPVLIKNKDLHNLRRREIYKFLKSGNKCPRCKKPDKSPYVLCKNCRKNKKHSSRI